MYVGRLAPSPTGRIHLGIARTSLLAWLDTRAAGGRLLLRIEDIDQTRCRPEHAAGILDDLRWLGLDWDAGPDRAGPEGPFTQSERAGHYRAALERLTAMGRIYPCTCSRKEIALAASAPHGPSDEGPRYPETCRAGAVPKPGRRPALRLKTKPEDFIAHRDRRRGDLSQNVYRAVGDFVVQRSDQHWAYQLAVAVDDAEQGVTTIVRGDDLARSTARQLLLRQLLYPAAPPLDTLHVPLLLDADGTRIAKRTGGHTIAQLRADGVRPERIIGALAASLGLAAQTTTEWTTTECRPGDLIEPWRSARRGADLVDRPEALRW